MVYATKKKGAISDRCCLLSVRLSWTRPKRWNSCNVPIKQKGRWTPFLSPKQKLEGDWTSSLSITLKRSRHIFDDLSRFIVVAAPQCTELSITLAITGRRRRPHLHFSSSCVVASATPADFCRNSSSSRSRSSETPCVSPASSSSEAFRGPASSSCPLVSSQLNGAGRTGNGIQCNVAQDGWRRSTNFNSESSSYRAIFFTAFQFIVGHLKELKGSTRLFQSCAIIACHTVLRSDIKFHVGKINDERKENGMLRLTTICNVFNRHKIE